MKKILLSLTALFTISGLAFGQALLYNDGAMIKVQSGAVLTVEGGIENTASGTIDNDGTIEVHGNFVNAGTWEASDANTLRFAGANDANVTSGTAVFHTVEMDKDAGGDVMLMDNMTVSNDLNFVGDDNQIHIGSNNLVFQNAATVSDYDANEYIVTGSTGYVRKMGLDASEAFTFPVGYDESTYNPATLTASGSHTGDNFNVRVMENVLEDGLTGSVITDDVVDASWEINEDAPGSSDVTVNLQWAGTDELGSFDNSSAGVSKHDGTDWDLDFDNLTAAAGSDPYNLSRAGVNSFSVFAVGAAPLGNRITLQLNAMLQGPYETGPMLMRDNLRTMGLLPTTEPYSGLGYNYTGFGGGESSSNFDNPADEDDIVDWVIVELRDKNNNTVVKASRSALLQRDGDIVDLDGSSPLVISGAPDDDYFVVIDHRNHNGNMTLTTRALALGATSIDYTSESLFRFSPAASNSPSVLIDGMNMLWMGDISGDGIVSYNGGANPGRTDLFNYILNAPGNGFGSATFAYTAYSTYDIELDGVSSYNGGAIPGRTKLFNLLLNHPGNGFGSGTYTFLEQLP